MAIVPSLAAVALLVSPHKSPDGERILVTLGWVSEGGISVLEFGLSCSTRPNEQKNAGCTGRSRSSLAGAASRSSRTKRVEQVDVDLVDALKISRPSAYLYKQVEDSKVPG